MRKYNEDKILKEIGDYIKGTYGQHYAQVSKGTQVQDLLRDIGIDKDFCQANANEFNYSSNPSYLNGSKIRVKDVSQDSPSAYITSVGLYSADNELLATAKVSEPLKKDPSSTLTLRVRLDY